MKMMYAFMWWMCINLVVWTVGSMEVPGVTLGSIEGTDAGEVWSGFDPNATIQGWTGEDEPFQTGSPIRAIMNLWDTVGPAVASVPYILGEWGAPTAMVALFSAIWMMGWAWFAWGFISGRILS